MPKSFQPVMLITGTSRGLGKEIADHFLKEGYRVAGFSRGPSSLNPPNYWHFQLDITDEKAVTAAFKEIDDKWERVDVLINNAGVAAMNSLLLTPIATLRAVLDTNLTGAFLFSREAAKRMVQQKFGRIINFLSVALPMELEGESAYVASKAGLLSLTHTFAKELGPHGITVNAIGPTPMDTNLIKGVPPQKIDAILQAQAIHKKAQISDVLHTLNFFCDRKSSLITGQSLYLGGVF